MRFLSTMAQALCLQNLSDQDGLMQQKNKKTKKYHAKPSQLMNISSQFAQIVKHVGCLSRML